MIIELAIATTKQIEFVEITDHVCRAVTDSGVTEGVLVAYTPHTTAAITINENADPDVIADMTYALEKLVPLSDPAYLHAEGNSAAHLKSSLIGCDQSIPIKDGRPVLGIWQGIFFCEFDGPRTRKVYVKMTS